MRRPPCGSVAGRTCWAWRGGQKRGGWEGVGVVEAGGWEGERGGRKSRACLSGRRGGGTGFRLAGARLHNGSSRREGGGEGVLTMDLGGGGCPLKEGRAGSVGGEGGCRELGGGKVCGWKWMPQLG